MSEVKRYTPSMRVGHMVKDKDGLWNRSQDFDRVTAERDALQALLTAADERADELEGLLQRVYDADLAARHHLPYNVSRLMDDIEAALKPTEGGGDEAV